MRLVICYKNSLVTVVVYSMRVVICYKNSLVCEPVVPKLCVSLRLWGTRDHTCSCVGGSSRGVAHPRTVAAAATGVLRPREQQWQQQQQQQGTPPYWTRSGHNSAVVGRIQGC